MPDVYYSPRTEDQVTPPSEVWNVLTVPGCCSGTNEIQACKASAARTAVRSCVTGDSNLIQCLPPSVVRKIVPEAPTTQQTFAEGAEPATRSAVTPLSCRAHLTPLSEECSSEPAGPRRQSCFPPGAKKTCGFCSAASRIIALAREGVSGSAEISTDWAAVEIASALADFSFGAATLEAGAGAGVFFARGAGTVPSARKPGSEAGGGGGAAATICPPTAEGLGAARASSFF